MLLSLQFCCGHGSGTVGRSDWCWVGTRLHWSCGDANIAEGWVLWGRGNGDGLGKAKGSCSNRLQSLSMSNQVFLISSSSLSGEVRKNHAPVAQLCFWSSGAREEGKE